VPAVSDLAVSAQAAVPHDVAPQAVASSDRAPTRLERPWRRAWLAGLSTWAVSVATYALINVVFWTVNTQPAPPLRDLIDVWFRYDTEHYIGIAEQGYTASSAAFFPLYPLLMAIVDPVLPGGMLVSGLFVASIGCVVALAFIYRLVEDLFDSGVSQRTVQYLMAFPFAFYLVAAYNESLFLALAAGSLYCMRRGQWWYAGALAGLASATRYFGVLLGLAFVIEYLRQRDWRWRGVRLDALGVLLVPAGLVAFMIYSARAFGDPLLFAHRQQTGWGHQLSPPWRGITDTIGQIGTWSQQSPLNAYAVLNLIDLVAVLVAIALLVMSVVGPWRLGPGSWYLVAFGGAALFMAMLSPMVTGLPPLHGLPRYALEILPIFIVLGRIGARRGFERAYLFPAIALQTALLIAFFANVYVS
jgi:hypothetical protein